MTRVAVCISGAFRGNFDALTTIDKNIVRPLKADVIFATWDRKYLWPGMFDIGSFTGHRYLGYRICDLLPQKQISFIQIKEIFPSAFKKMIEPVISELTEDDYKKIKEFLPSLRKFVQVDEARFNSVAHEFFAGYLSSSPPKMINQLKMFFLMFKCNNLLSELEKECGYSFDYVIKVRPDIILDHPLDFGTLSKLKNDEVMMKFFWCGLDDVLFFGDRSSIDKITSLWTKIIHKRRLSPFDKFPWASDHFLLLLQCLSEQLKIVPSDNVPIFNIDLESVRRAGVNTTIFFQDMLNDLQKDGGENQYARVKSYLEEQINANK